VPERGAAFLATGVLISSLWVVWVALHSWSQERPEDRTIRPTLVTLGAIGLSFLAAMLIPWPRPWAAIAIFVGPISSTYYLRKGVPDPGRRRVMSVAMTLAFVAVLAGLFVLESAGLLA
jgi:heme/copper-type cytochrome/quinol oxidase subunit 3